jgi:hypothetical protein
MLKEFNEAKQGLTDHYNKELEKIINQNSAKDKYWILGKVRFPEELGGKVGRAFLEACDEKPGLIKDAFLYEVDNRNGTKTLLWIMNPDGSLRLPTLNKTVQATPANRAQKGRKR